MNNKRAAILLIIGSLCLIFGIYSMSSSRFLGLMLLLIWAGTFTVGLSWFIVGRKYDDKEKLYDYDKNSWTMTIKERNPKISGHISVIADRDAKWGYKKPEIRFSAVTVGGVTTGGIYQTEGKHYVESFKKNGNYILWNKLEQWSVRKIIIPDNEIKNAVNSPISKFLSDDHKMIVFHDGSREDAQAVLDWICGENK